MYLNKHFRNYKDLNLNIFIFNNFLKPRNYFLSVDFDNSNIDINQTQ